MSDEIVIWSIGVDRPIEPSEPLQATPVIPPGALVVLEGRAPIWRYCQALHLLHGSPAGAIAVFDPKLGGAVVVASHRRQYTEGQIVKMEAQP